MEIIRAVVLQNVNAHEELPVTTKLQGVYLQILHCLLLRTA